MWLRRWGTDLWSSRDDRALGEQNLGWTWLPQWAEPAFDYRANKRESDEDVLD